MRGLALRRALLLVEVRDAAFCLLVCPATRQVSVRTSAARRSSHRSATAGDARRDTLVLASGKAVDPGSLVDGGIEDDKGCLVPG